MKYYVMFSNLTGEVEQVNVVHGNPPERDGYTTQMFDGKLEDVADYAKRWKAQYHAIKKFEPFADFRIYLFTNYDSGDIKLLIDDDDDNAELRMKLLHPEYTMSDCYEITDIV
jgi:hypothetical protein